MERRRFLYTASAVIIIFCKKGHGWSMSSTFITALANPADEWSHCQSLTYWYTYKETKKINTFQRNKMSFQVMTVLRANSEDNVWEVQMITLQIKSSVFFFLSIVTQRKNQ